jgi:hypothetical protein
MKNCILCGKPHEKGTPHDWEGLDDIFAGKITIPPSVKKFKEIAVEAEIRKQRGRPKNAR